MLIAKCLKGKYEAKLESQGGEGNKPNNNPWWKYRIFFLTTLFCHTNHLLLAKCLKGLKSKYEAKL